MAEETIESLQEKCAHLQQMWDECAWEALSSWTDRKLLADGEKTYSRVIPEDLDFSKAGFKDGRILLLLDDGIVFDSKNPKSGQPSTMRGLLGIAAKDPSGNWSIVVELDSRITKFTMLDNFYWENR